MVYTIITIIVTLVNPWSPHWVFPAKPGQKPLVSTDTWRMTRRVAVNEEAKLLQSCQVYQAIKMSQNRPRNKFFNQNGCAKVRLSKSIELNDVNQQITNCSQAFKSIDEDIAGVVPCRSGDEIPPMILPWGKLTTRKNDGETPGKPSANAGFSTSMWVYSKDQQGIHNDKPALISSWAVWSLGCVPFQSQMTSLFGGYPLIHRGGLGLTLSNFPPIAIKWGYPLIFTQDKTTPLVIQSKPLNHLDLWDRNPRDFGCVKFRPFKTI